MQTAISDIRAGLGRLDLAAALAWEDLKDRYRRSYIGLSWIILSFFAFIAIKGLVFSSLFSSEGYDFFSHLVIGFALFGFMSATISGGASLFVSNRTWILSSNQPYTVYAHNLILRALAELGLIALASVGLIIFVGDINPGYLWTLPFAVLLYYITAFAICLTFAPIGARFRDFVYAVQTVMRIMFFATPIIWVPKSGSNRETIAKYNPLTYYLDIIRGPVIEGYLPVHSWLICFTISFFLLILGLITLEGNKRKVPLWL